MTARSFTFDQFDDLHGQAKASPRQRQRQYLYIHASHEAPFQRLFIAFGLDSYVRPHRHHLVPKDETLIAAQGLLGVLVFDDAGQVVQHSSWAPNAMPHRASAPWWTCPQAHGTPCWR